MSTHKRELIRKLLALAADPSAAPQEAETAARQAARLMAKHDIDLADLEEEALKAQFDLIQGEAVGCRPGKRDAKEVPPWIGIIAWGIKCYTRTRVSSRGGVVYFRGPREAGPMAPEYSSRGGVQSQSGAGKHSALKQTAEGYQAGQNASIPSGRPVSQSYLRLN